MNRFIITCIAFVPFNLASYHLDRLFFTWMIFELGYDVLKKYCLSSKDMVQQVVAFWTRILRKLAYIYNAENIVQKVGSVKNIELYL